MQLKIIWFIATVITAFTIVVAIRQTPYKKRITKLSAQTKPEQDSVSVSNLPYYNFIQ